MTNTINVKEKVEPMEDNVMNNEIMSNALTTEI